MPTWFNVAPAICVVMPNQESVRIFEAMDVARARLNFRADGGWLSALSDFRERYQGDFFMVGVEIHPEGETTKRRYIPRGPNNYLLKVPLDEIASLPNPAMAEFFEDHFIKCCQDAAKRWGATISWRVEPELRSPTN